MTPPWLVLFSCLWHVKHPLYLILYIALQVSKNCTVKYLHPISFIFQSSTEASTCKLTNFTNRWYQQAQSSTNSQGTGPLFSPIGSRSPPMSTHHQPTSYLGRSPLSNPVGDKPIVSFKSHLLRFENLTCCLCFFNLFGVSS